MPVKILLLDASTEALSVAVSTNLEDSFFEECPQQHSQKMLPEIERQLNLATVNLNDIDAIAFGKGPGSFTGVRVGVSVTQGLAYAAQKPVIAISTLQIMAQQCLDCTTNNDVFVAIDARMGEIYFAHYHRNDEGFAQMIGSECVIVPTELTLPNIKAAAIGTGFETYKHVFEQQQQLDFIVDIRLPNVKFVAKLAEVEYTQGKGVVAKDAQPSYVRDTVTWKKLPGKE